MKKNLFTSILFFVFVPIYAQQMPEAWFRLQAAIEQHEKSKALEWSDSCSKLKPLRYQYLVACGQAQYINGNYNDAIEFFTKAETTRKGSASFWLAKSYCLVGDTAKCFIWLTKNLESAQRVKESEILLDDAFKSIQNSEHWKYLWSKDWYTSLDKAIAEAQYLNENQQWEETLDLLNARIKGTKSRFLLYALRGDAYYGLNNPAAAADDYSIAYKKSRGNVMYLVKIAQTYIARNQYQLALKRVDEAISKSGKDPSICLIRAGVFAKLGQASNAYDDLKYYLDFYPNNTAAIELLSECAYNAGRYVDALFALAKLTKTNPENPKYRYLRGLTYIKTEQYRVAIADFDFVIAKGYNVADAYYNKAISFTGLGEIFEACKCFSISHQYGNFDSQQFLYKYCKIQQPN